MLAMRDRRFHAWLWLACTFAAASAAGCSGSTELTGPEQGVGGAWDVDGSTGGSSSGGDGGSAGTSSGGDGGYAGTGTGGIGGSAGTGVGGMGGDGGTGSIPDAALPDAMQVDAGTCSVVFQACDPAADDCCAPLSCVEGSNGARCRPPLSDGGMDAAVCAAPQQPCTQVDCCPGLECIPQGPTQICRFPMDAGLFDATVPETGTCRDLGETCGPGNGPCCQSLTCKKDPNDPTQRICQSDQVNPPQCPTQEPSNGAPCTVVGVQCSYGMMTVCLCTDTGWECAY